MKKILSLLLCLCTLFGCSSTKEEPTKQLSLLSPSGAPSLVLLNVDTTNLDYEFVSGSETLQASFTSSDTDIIIAPINLGCKLSSATGNYYLYSVVSWGNLYYLSKTDNQTTIAAFGQASVVGKVITSLNEFKDKTIDWFDSVNEAMQATLTGKYEAVILAEPVVTMFKSKTEGFNSVSIQDLYKVQYNLDSYPQAALFVNKETYNEYQSQIDSLVSQMDNNVTEFNTNSQSLSKVIDETDLTIYGFSNPDLIKNAYSRMSLNIENANEHVDEIKNILSLCGMELDENILIK